MNRTNRQVVDLEDRLDELTRRHGRHAAIIRPNRHTRYDADLISRREMEAVVTSAVATAGGVVPVFDDLTPNLTETGTAWTLSETPTDAANAMVFLNGQKLRKVTAGPTASQYTLSGTTLTTGRSLIAGERLEAIYEGTGERMAWEDLTPLLSETGATWTLTNTPATDKIAAFLNGSKLRKVAAAPTSSQFTLSGVTLTTGRSLIAGERLEVFYAF